MRCRTRGGAVVPSRPDPRPDPIEDPPSVAEREYYETSGYFRSGGRHLRDPGSRFHRYRIRHVLALCGPLEGRRAVDLGCGWGTLSFALAARCPEVVGVDFAEAAVAICRLRLEREPREGLRFVRADAAATGLPAGEWDLVVAADLVEHLSPADTRRVYREAHRLLRAGGRFVVWTPNPGHFLERLRRRGILRADPTHVDYKTLGRVVRELEVEGFEIVRAAHAPSHLPFLRVAERGLQRWVPCLRRRIAVAACVPE